MDTVHRVAPAPAQATVDASDSHGPDKPTRPVGHTTPLTEGELSALLADFRPLVQRLVRAYGTVPELRQQLDATLERQFRTLVELFDPACGRSLKAHLVASLSEAAYLCARAGSAHSHPDREAGALAATVTHGAPEHVGALTLAISQLPLRQRKTVIRWYYEGFSIEEIAVQLGVRPATVRRLLHRAVSTLRRQLRTPFRSPSTDSRGRQGGRR